MMPSVTRRLVIVFLLATFAAGCGSGNSSPPSTAPPGEAVQEPGSYIYATRGFDRVEAIVPSRHDYPDETTVTVTKESCGIAERWDALPERWNVTTFCISGKKWRLRSIVDFHEFFGQSVREQYDCTGDLIPRPALIKVGTRWADHCRSSRGTATISGAVLGAEDVEVDGKKVSTVRFRLRARLRGSIRGVNTSDSWLQRTNGLLIRRAVTSTTEVDSEVGPVTGTERYSLVLKSLKPE
jgi:hypothetical protein